MNLNRLIGKLYNNKGLTLIEVLLGLVFIGLVVGTTFSFYTSGYDYYRSGSTTYDVMKNIRLVADFMTQELRYATNVAVIAEPLEGDEPLLVELLRNWINSFASTIEGEVEGYSFFYIENEIEDEMGLFKHVIIKERNEAPNGYETINTDHNDYKIRKGVNAEGEEEIVIQIEDNGSYTYFDLVEKTPFSDIAKRTVDGETEIYVALDNLSFNIRGPLLTYTIKDSHDDNLKISSTLRLLNFKNSTPTTHYAERYLFKEGEEYKDEEVEDMWDIYHPNSINGVSANFGYIDNNLIYLFADNDEEEETASVTENQIDLTGVKYIEIDWENTGTSDDENESYLIISTEDNNNAHNDTDDVVRITEENSFLRTVKKSEELNLSGSYYIRVHAVSDNDDYISELKVYNIRLIYGRYTAIAYKSP